MTVKRYRYYNSQRPVGPGTYPTDVQKPTAVVNFDDRTECEGGVRAWGYVEYLEPLSDYDLWLWELEEGGVYGG